MYSNSSNTTMKVILLKFYPLHINVINFMESMQYMMCIHGLNIAFIPVAFMDNIKGKYVEINMLPRIERLKNV